MQIIASVIMVLLSLLPMSAQAQSAPTTPDLEAGKRAYGVCASCHGITGQGNVARKAPRLTHLDSTYIVAQLEKFRAGTRGGAESSVASQQMAGMSTTLASDQAVVDVASFIATLEAPPAVATVVGDPKIGADYYNQLCGACHGADAQGNRALSSPRLAGADDWYLVEQLMAFRAGTRGANPGDKTGRQMRAMAALLPDDNTIADVVAFIRDVDQ